MKACRTASIVAFGALGAALAIGACHESVRVDVPPVTTAKPGDAPVLGAASTSIATDAAPPADDAGALAKDPPAKVTFVDVPGSVETEVCTRVLVAIAKGTVKASGETLGPGDVLALTYPVPFKLEGPSGLVVLAVESIEPCTIRDKPDVVKKVIRAKEAPELRFAKGAMAVHLDVGGKVSPSLYMGRLEGTAAVPEHTHPGSWEFVAAIEANGTFVLDGTEGRLGPKQVVMVPPGAKHAWKPEPGSKLVAWQLYSPPGPEQRFVALAAADKDAGVANTADAGAKR